MKWLRQLFSRRRRRYDDLSVSIHEHLEEKIDELMDDGMSVEEATRTARCEFGNVTLIEERSREAWQWPTLESLCADTKFAGRQLKKSPGFALTAILTLALGIGANTAVFSVINTVLLHPLPYKDPSRLVLVSETLPQLGKDEVGMSAAEYVDYQGQNRVFAQTAAFTNFYGDAFNLTGSGQPVRVNAAQISASALPLLGVAPTIGRNFTTEEDRPGAGHVVLLSHALWQSQYGADPGILGKTIHLDEKPYTVIGVMPASFRFPFDRAPLSERASLWLPMAFDPHLFDPSKRVNSFGVGFIGRLNPGMTTQQTQRDVEQIAANFMRQHADIYIGNIRVAPHVFPFIAHTTEKARPLLILLAASVACVLLIACANVANLLLARANARRQEMALRAAVGAGRARILRQCLVESALLAFLGAVAGVLLAVALVFGFRSFGPADLPRLQDVTLHPIALAFTFALALLTSIAFGFAPAWRLSRIAPQSSLKESTQVGSGHTSQRVQNVIAAAEIALALVLLITGGLLLRSFMRLLDSPFGFDPKNAFVVRTIFDRGRYPEAAKRTAVQKELLDRLSHLPGITAIAEASHLPLSDTRQIGFRLEHSAPNDFHWVENSLISPGYFRAMGITLRQGRDFIDQDRPNSQSVVIISQAFARQYFPHQDPIGKRLLWGDPPGFTVIGIAADVHNSALDADPPPMTYFSMFQVERETSKTAFILRGKSAGPELLPEIRKQISSLDKELPLYDTTTLQSFVSESLTQRHFTILLLGSFALIALVLAAIGVFGVNSYIAAQRSREFGVRVALGADRASIAWLVLRRGAAIAVAGCACGLILSIFASRLLLASLYRTSQYDPMTLCLVPTILFVVVLLAAWLPARQAAKVDPMQALRGE
jgi:predicted permease